jgi:hypothetical protein
MPEVRVGRNIWGPAVHVIQDSGMSLCGRPARQFVEPKNKTKKPEPCAMCFSMAQSYGIDMDWLINEIDGVRSMYGG